MSAGYGPCKPTAASPAAGTRIAGASRSLMGCTETLPALIQHLVKALMLVSSSPCSLCD